MTNASDRIKAIELVREAQDSGARLVPICKELNISVRTYQRWVLDGEIHFDKRPTADRPAPKNKITEEEYNRIIEISNSAEYVSMPPSQIVPSLADKGEYIASESTFYRTLRQEDMQKHRGRSKPPLKSVPTTHIATAPNQLWSWDITWLAAAVLGMYFKLYLVIDVFSRKIVAWEIWEEETGEHAANLIEKAVISEKTCGRPVILHSDNGSPMKSATLLATLEKLCVAASYSRPRVSNDNPYSESIFRTCKYRPDFPYKGFASIEDARDWVSRFVHWYNNIHHHSGIKFVTPNERHSGRADEILRNRKKVYEAAKARHPERWTGETRNWILTDTVALNPTDEMKKQLKIAV